MLRAPKIDGFTVLAAFHRNEKLYAAWSTKSGERVGVMYVEGAKHPGDATEAFAIVGGKEVKFPDGSKVMLSPLSQFKVDSTDRKETMLSLSLGKLRAAFSGLMSSRVSIHTPTAVCAVRGTDFTVSSDADGNTTVEVQEGAVLTGNKSGETAMVRQGQFARIPARGRMTEPRHNPNHRGQP